ncbi:hypothetical protein K458DRAFT_396815 [Lentithecium fluviatile CBS 122367]|uniref:Uncharacterized protein n=1 Tax=Lentithecium fluviatile CBS 122367 TaxID=1168545 RepID=A0A6G1IEI7_9PLEO|nr:hypothetical protein K458DRAFT_396815 [Lentithecium fluviatile CBS 122367]
MSVCKEPKVSLKQSVVALGPKRKHSAFVMDEELKCLREAWVGTPHISELQANNDVSAQPSVEELSVVHETLTGSKRPVEGDWVLYLVFTIVFRLFKTEELGPAFHDYNILSRFVYYFYFLLTTVPAIESVFFGKTVLGASQTGMYNPW